MESGPRNASIYWKRLSGFVMMGLPKLSDRPEILRHRVRPVKVILEEIGRIGFPDRLIVELHSLKHAFKESDESVLKLFNCGRWGNQAMSIIITAGRSATTGCVDLFFLSGRL
jgi:hypothetical protein